MICFYCSHDGATWEDGDHRRICFACLRQQRLRFKENAAAHEAEAQSLRTTVAELAETIGNLQSQIHNPRLCDGNAAGRFVVLKADLQQLQSTLGRILKGLEGEE